MKNVETFMNVDRAERQRHKNNQNSPLIGGGSNGHNIYAMVQRRKTVEGHDTGLRFTMDQQQQQVARGVGSHPNRRNSIREDIKRKLTLHTP